MTQLLVRTAGAVSRGEELVDAQEPRRHLRRKPSAGRTLTSGTRTSQRARERASQPVFEGGLSKFGRRRHAVDTQRSAVTSSDEIDAQSWRENLMPAVPHAAWHTLRSSVGMTNSAELVDESTVEYPSLGEADYALALELTRRVQRIVGAVPRKRDSHAHRLALALTGEVCDELEKLARAQTIHPANDAHPIGAIGAGSRH